jgi:predicted DsbA family dithiol-disulfide isomerase
MTDDQVSTPGSSGRSLRRALVFGGVATGIALALSGPSWLRRQFAGSLEFEQLREPAGFRRVTSGEMRSTVLALQPTNPGNSLQTWATQRSNFCEALFGATTIPNGVVPIASFSDYNCPYCRLLTAEVARVDAEARGTVRVTWHEWPIFGPNSETAARAALAAGQQGAYFPVHRRLMRSGFAPTPQYLEDVAAGADIDSVRLMADMESPMVAAALDTSRKLAGLFAFPGTPALVVGRTVVVGNVGRGTLLTLIDLERREGSPPGCE